MPCQLNLPRRFPFLFVLLVSVALPFTGHTQPGTARKIEQLLDKAASLHRFNGTALVTRKGKVVFEKAYGYRNVDQKAPNSATTVYQIGSTTKQFTAALVLQLAEQGKLSLADKLGHYFPVFAAGKEVTVQQLLSHTSGIYEIFRSPEFYQLDKSRPLSKEQLLSFYLTQPLDFAPGTRFNYCNSGYHLLGLIIEQVTGKTYEQNVRDRFLKPLNMRHSGFAFSQVPSKDKATGYKDFSTTSHVASAPWDSTVTYAAGALYSTTHDLLSWQNGLFKNKVLTDASLKRATTPVRNGYGLGCWLDSLHHRQVVSHGGNIEGFTSYVARMPAEELSVVLLNNIHNRELESIGQAIFSILLQQPYQFFNDVQLPVETLEQYVGQYDVNPSCQITISRTNGQLLLRINNEAPTKIFADKEHSFYDKNEDRRIRFSGKEGRINSITLMQGLSTKQGDKLANRR